MTFQHHVFNELPQLLSPNDVLVFNETKVIPARLHGHKKQSGGRVELLLLRRIEPALWECMVGGKGLHEGVRITLPGDLEACVVSDEGHTRRIVRFSIPIGTHLATLGEMPLPPYITTPVRDEGKYQTTYARQPGSVAAPTAGLHFTERLLAELSDIGIKMLFLTLHIGLDTFAPVRSESPENHIIHTEWYSLSEQVASMLNSARASGSRIIAVGTSTVRALESACKGDHLEPFEGPTSLFILPGYQFQVVDALITNFHLPKSSLLMLVSAFGGYERMMSAYQTAILADYRFYSFGDAMLIE